MQQAHAVQTLFERWKPPFFQPAVLPPRVVLPRMKDATTQTLTINHTTTQTGDLLSLLEVAKMSSKATRDVLSSVRSSRSFRPSVDVLEGRAPLSPLKNLRPSALLRDSSNKNEKKKPRLSHSACERDLLSASFDLQAIPFPDFVPIPLDYELPSAQLSRQISIAKI